MPKNYCHLTYDKRCQIYAFLKSGCAKTEVALLLGVHRSTITNELKRNTGGRGIAISRRRRKRPPGAPPHRARRAK